MRELRSHLGSSFKWLEPPYEYVHDLEPIDILNGTDELRLWVEREGHLEELDAYETADGFRKYTDEKQRIALY